MQNFIINILLLIFEIIQVITNIISLKICVVNYDKETGDWINLIDKLKTTAPITREVRDALDALNDINIANITSAEQLGKRIGYTDEQFFKFAKQADMSGDLLNQYEEYMKKAGKATSVFGSTLKSIGANLGIMLAITLAVQALSAAWDHLNVTMEEQQEIVDGLKTDIEGLKIEYDEFVKRAKDNLTNKNQPL